MESSKEDAVDDAGRNGGHHAEQESEYQQTARSRPVGRPTDKEPQPENAGRKGQQGEYERFQYVCLFPHHNRIAD